MHLVCDGCSLVLICVIRHLSTTTPYSCRNKEKIDKITSSLKLKMSVRGFKMGDPRAHIFAICSQWLPLARAVLEMVTRKLPSPLEVSRARAERLMCNSTKTFDSLPPSTQELKRGEMER